MQAAYDIAQAKGREDQIKVEPYEPRPVAQGAGPIAPVGVAGEARYRACPLFLPRSASGFPISWPSFGCGLLTATQDPQQYGLGLITVEGKRPLRLVQFAPMLALQVIESRLEIAES